MTTRKIPFDQWFREQFGERPSDKETWQLLEELRELRERVRLASDLLEDCQRWDDIYTAAKEGNTASKYVLRPGVIVDE